MYMTYNELDVVALAHEIQQYGLSEGDTGTIVSVYNNGDAFEVEFVNRRGETIALITLAPSDIRSVPESSTVLRWINEPIWSGLKPIINTESKSIEARTEKFYSQYI